MISKQIPSEYFSANDEEIRDSFLLLHGCLRSWVEWETSTGASCAAAKYIWRAGEGGCCLDGLCRNEVLPSLLDNLTFRRKLLNIKHSVKHEKSQECWYRWCEEFLLNQSFDFTHEPEITRYQLSSRYIQGLMSQGVTVHDLTVQWKT